MKMNSMLLCVAMAVATVNAETTVPYGGGGWNNGIECPSYNDFNPFQGPRNYCIDGWLYRCEYAGEPSPYLLDTCYSSYCSQDSNGLAMCAPVAVAVPTALDAFQAPLVGYAIRGHNDRTLEGVWNVEACAQNCLEQSWCAAFEYSSKQGMCVLSSVSSPVTAPNQAVYGSWTLYIRHIIQSPVLPPSINPPSINPLPPSGTCQRPEWGYGSYCTGEFGVFKGRDLAFQLCYPNTPKPVPYLLPGVISEETCNRWETVVCEDALRQFVSNCCPSQRGTIDYLEMQRLCVTNLN